MSEVTIPWACPKCGAKANKHGKGDCKSKREAAQRACSGFICECETETSSAHGTTFADPCPSAICYHCSWDGRFPMKPKGIQKWEQQAIAAGWDPPDARRVELGLPLRGAVGP